LAARPCFDAVQFSGVEKPALAKPLGRRSARHYAHRRRQSGALARDPATKSGGSPPGITTVSDGIGNLPGRPRQRRLFRNRKPPRPRQRISRPNAAWLTPEKAETLKLRS